MRSQRGRAGTRAVPDGQPAKYRNVEPSKMVPQHINHRPFAMRLEAGDLIYTGTPDGVGAIVSGDDVVVHVDGVCDLNIKIG